jgi:hypothetical protein
MDDDWYQGSAWNNEDEIAYEADAPWLNGDWEDPYEDVTDAAWEDDCWSESLRDYIR